MNNPFYVWFAPLFVAGATVMSFLHYATEAPNALFWINMFYTVMLEVIFFVWLFKGRKYHH
jgi:hypothetical protein